MRGEKSVAEVVHPGEFLSIGCDGVRDSNNDTLVSSRLCPVGWQDLSA
jgi:hypothetical protein